METKSGQLQIRVTPAEKAALKRLAANAGQVVLLPLIAGGLWKITASGDYIGDEYKNRWWENLAVGALFLLAIWGAFESALVVLR